MSDLAFVPVGGGKLALTHRPKKADLLAFGTQGITHVVTLLGEREGAKDLGALAAKAGVQWIWCPLDGASTAITADQVSSGLSAAKMALRDGGVVVIHCSAGIHRTGMFGYALLRLVGLDRTEAMAKLQALRAVTAEGVGADRLDWGDRIADALA